MSMSRAPTAAAVIAVGSPSCWWWREEGETERERMELVTNDL